MADSFTKLVKWRTEALMHTVLEWFFSLLPPPAVFHVGNFLGAALWPLMKKRQSFIERNLRIVFGEQKSIAEVRELARDSFIRSVANLVSSFCCKNIDEKKLQSLLTVENPELLEDAIAKGRGVIVLLAHMGNWELLTRLNFLFPEGTPSGAFYRPLNNPVMDRRVRKQREAEGTRLFSKRDSLHNVSGYLREGAVIGILTDQRVGRQGELTEFFGRLTRASPLPSLLVRRRKSEVVSLSLRTEKPGKWIARYHAVDRPYHTEHCMAALETAMRESVIDVFWLQERWRMYLRKNFPPSAWLKTSEARGKKAHRALIWADQETKDRPLPTGYDHGDIDYEICVGRSAEELPTIDESGALPIDFILSFLDSPELKRAAAELAIPVIFASQLRSE